MAATSTLSIPVAYSSRQRGSRCPWKTNRIRDSGAGTVVRKTRATARVFLPCHSEWMAIQAPPNGTYGAKMPGNPVVRKLFSLYVRIHVRSYRRSGGSDRMSRGWDFPVVLLTTKGARSGRERITALGGFPDGDNAWLVVASMGGMAHHPAWFYNMMSNPDDLWLEVGKRRVKVRGQSLVGAERTAALGRIASISPRYGKYQEQTDREIPIVRLTVS